MKKKDNGMSVDLLIHPGETVAEVLAERGMTQKELACRAGVSGAFLSSGIRGKKDISRGLAMGLGYALGVPASFWLNLQARYDAELLSLREESTVTEEETAVMTDIREAVDLLRKNGVLTEDMTSGQTVVALRRYFRVSRLDDIWKLLPGEDDGIRPEDAGTLSRAAWRCIREREKQQPR